MFQEISNRILMKFSVVPELFSFLWRQRLWWMIPMVTVLLLLGLLMLLSENSAIAPLIYPLF